MSKGSDKRRRVKLAKMCDRLQITEMSMGYRYMLNSALNSRYERLKAVDPEHRRAAAQALEPGTVVRP
jgi:hypothetical protein